MLLTDTDENQRSVIRLALPSKGRMEDETVEFLQNCGLSVKKFNPRQYIAYIPELDNLEIWFQRTADVVRKVRDGDIDLGIVGFDKIAEYRGSDESVVIIHDALGYSPCHVSVAVPEAWSEINTMADLARLAAERSDTRPLRVVSKYARLAESFLQDHHVSPFRILHADGALEAAPQMGTADFIIDVVSTGVTLRENRLKELEDGLLLRSQATFIGNRRALTERPEVLALTHEFLERFEAHLRALDHLTVIANMRGQSAEDVAQKVFSQPNLGGLQGPTISQVYLREPSETNWYAISIVVPKKRLYEAIRQIRQIGGSGVLVLPLRYIFEEEPPRWQKLLETLNLVNTPHGR
ncbi:MAG: ATP phosphoribosyltransferase [Anaerolineae bacterium]|nr:ATP phosphoribosyltransferase [Anaerolineae bacterium]